MSLRGCSTRWGPAVQNYTFATLRASLIAVSQGTISSFLSGAIEVRWIYLHRHTDWVICTCLHMCYEQNTTVISERAIA